VGCLGNIFKKIMETQSLQNISQLYKFEFVKLAKKSFLMSYVVVIILAVILTSVYFDKVYNANEGGSYSSNWRYDLERKIQDNENYLANTDIVKPENQVRRAIEQIAIYQWYLDNDIKPYDTKSVSGLIELSMLFSL
jgi:hypothetical protein